MFATKTAKDEKNDFVVYHPYPFDGKIPLGYDSGEDIPNEGCQCVSIDVGIVNFAIRIENRLPNGGVVPIYFNKINFTNYGNTSERSGTATINPQILFSSRKFFYDLLPYLKKSRIVVIERQLSINVKSSKMAQHILTLFLDHVDSFDYPCIITDVNSKLKGQIFNAPKGLNKNELKTWAIEKALEVLKFRGDQASIQSILYHKGKTKTKADDLADTIMQLDALIITWRGLTSLIPETLYRTIKLKMSNQIEKHDEIQAREQKNNSSSIILKLILDS